MLLSQIFFQNFSQKSPQNSPFASAQNLIQNPSQNAHKSESVSGFDTLFALHSQKNKDSLQSAIPLNAIPLDMSLALGYESQTPKQDLRFSALIRSSKFLESLNQAILPKEELNPLSYPRSLSVISEIMNEKLEEFYARTKDSNDPKLHLLLGIQEQFKQFDSVMRSLRSELTSKAEVFASLLPRDIDKNSNLFLERAQAVRESAGKFMVAANEGVAWINAFFSEFEENLSDREKSLIFNHANIIQTHWHIQTGGEDGKIVLDNGMIYQEYFDEKTPDIRGFTLITQNFVYAYREEILEDKTTQVVLQVYEKSAESGKQSNLDLSHQMRKSLDFSGQKLKLVGETSRIEKRF